jgi:hypothetical protein
VRSVCDLRELLGVTIVRSRVTGMLQLSLSFLACKCIDYCFVEMCMILSDEENHC